MTFHDPEFLFLLIPLIGLFGFWFLRGEKKRSSLPFSSTADWPKNNSWRLRFKKAPTLFKWAALVFFVVALARPQTTSEKVKKNTDGIDIVIALDISDSMMIEDMKPLNRIESAKETLKKFIEKRTSDRIGVVIFAGESFTLVPLTLDYPLLLDRVSGISTARKTRIKDGTALGVAMANAAGRLKESTAKSRVIIFLTDGENNSGTIDPETGLAIAKGYGIKIYSIGIGRDGPTSIPVFGKDFFGREVKSYQPFESTVNEGLLGRMAQETGGKFYRASQEDSLPKIFNEINQLEKTKIDINQFKKYHEEFPFFVVIGILLYVLGWLLNLTLLRRTP